MGTNIINVKYEDKFMPKTFSGKSYSYYTSIKVNVGDLVIAPTSKGDKIARVTKINIPEHDIEQIKPFLKTITSKINSDIYIQKNQILKEVA